MPYIKTNPLRIAGMVKPNDDYVFYDGEIPTAKHLKWESGSIVEDTDAEQAELDDMISISKLKIIDALAVLPDERAKFDTLMQNKDFKERWDAATELDMNYPLVAQALAQVGMNVDIVKREVQNA